MKIEYKYLQQYSERMAVEQIADDYRRLGYDVSIGCRLNDSRFRADLLAVNEKEKIVVEVKAGYLDADAKHNLAELAEYVRSLDDYKFKVAIVTPPRNRKIYIEGIESVLYEEFLNDVPDDLDSLATHVRIEEVSDVDVQTISVQGNDIDCSGTGVISVELQFGSDGDCCRGDGWTGSASFAFTFDASLTVDANGINEIEINSISVDTSNY